MEEEGDMQELGKLESRTAYSSLEELKAAWSEESCSASVRSSNEPSRSADNEVSTSRCDGDD